MEEHIRLSAAVNFKNFIKFQWTPSEESGITPKPAIPDAEKEQIKPLVVGLMLTTTPKVQAQVSEALSIISEHDFPQVISLQGH